MISEDGLLFQERLLEKENCQKCCVFFSILRISVAFGLTSLPLLSYFGLFQFTVLIQAFALSFSRGQPFLPVLQLPQAGQLGAEERLPQRGLSDRPGLPQADRHPGRGLQPRLLPALAAVCPGPGVSRIKRDQG